MGQCTTSTTGIRAIERAPTGRALRFALDPGVPIDIT
jgi:hypothetical protein